MIHDSFLPHCARSLKNIELVDDKFASHRSQKTRVDFLNSDDVWTRKIDPRRATAEEVGIKGEFNIKFSSASYAFAWNAFLLAVMPPLRIWWRWSFRDKYVVQGSLCGDITSVLLCYLCTALQVCLVHRSSKTWSYL